VIYGTTLGLVKTLGAPLERTRIIMQTKHMQNLKANERPSGSSLSIINSKLKVNLFFLQKSQVIRASLNFGGETMLIFIRLGCRCFLEFFFMTR
jgi:hypothetical protein